MTNDLFDRLTFVALAVFAGSLFVGCTERSSVDNLVSNPVKVPANSANARSWQKYSDDLETISNAIELNDEERNRVDTVFAEHDVIIGSFWDQNGPKLQQMEQEIKSAAKMTDSDGVRKAIEKSIPLRVQLQALFEARAKAVFAQLPPERARHWEAHLLAIRLLDLMESLRLNDDQVERVRDLSLQAANAAADQLNPATAGFYDLEKRVKEQVLDETQRESYEEFKRKLDLPATVE